MKYKLNIGERFTLLGILPQEGNFATLKVVRKLREKLSLSEDEIKYFEVKYIPTNGEISQITWNPDKSNEKKDFEFGDFAEDLIKSKLKNLNDKNKLEEKHITLYESFLYNKEDGKNG